MIDSDGHIIEFEPEVMQCLDRCGGRRLVNRFRQWAQRELFTWYKLSPAERRQRGIVRPVWWGMPTANTLDRATASAPRLLYERLDEFGFDFAVLYPTLGLPVPHIEDEELRRAACRAFNEYYAENYSEFSDRVAAVSIIPMHTPEEAIEELEYAVKVLKSKACMLAGYVLRPMSGSAKAPRSVQPYPFWLDTYGLDSAYDYDPVWKKCLELKVSPAFHSGGMGWGSRTSTSNFMYNRIGHFAAAGEALCKSLFMGGVTRRFPKLRFAFLECGAGWACALYADLVSHWEKRNLEAVENYNPARLDRKLLWELLTKYRKSVGPAPEETAERTQMLEEDYEELSMRDEFAPCKIKKPEDIKDLFIPRFFFGCEADDRVSAWAFKKSANPFNASLNAIFSSDIGHWDVPDMSGVLEEAFELVDNKFLTREQFREFTFVNPAKFYGGLNANFFKGTVVEGETRKLNSVS